MLVKRSGRLIDVDLRHQSKVTSDDSDKFFKISGDHVGVLILSALFITVGIAGGFFIRGPAHILGLNILMGALFNLIGLTMGGLILLDARAQRKRSRLDAVDDKCMFCGASTHSKLTVEHATALRDALTIAIESH